MLDYFSFGNKVEENVKKGDVYTFSFFIIDEKYQKQVMKLEFGFV